MHKRSFKVISPRAGGHSIMRSRSPVAAAKKASRSCRRKKCDVVVQDRKSGKKYKYRVSREYDPITVRRDGQRVVFKYAVSAKSLNK
jgi:hypothetical protein